MNADNFYPPTGAAVDVSTECAQYLLVRPAWNVKLASGSGIVWARCAGVIELMSI